MTAARFDPAGPLRGTLRPPADKSISHRAAILAAMGAGETAISNYLDAADTRSTLRAIEKLGATVDAADGGARWERLVHARATGSPSPATSASACAARSAPAIQRTM